jgi:hypothetical protein
MTSEVSTRSPVNYTGAANDPSLIAAIVDARPNNAAYQSASGVNLNIEYATAAGGGNLTSFLNAMYLSLRERLTDASPILQLNRTDRTPSFIASTVPHAVPVRVQLK